MAGSAAGGHRDCHRWSGGRDDRRRCGHEVLGPPLAVVVAPPWLAARVREPARVHPSTSLWRGPVKFFMSSFSSCCVVLIDEGEAEAPPSPALAKPCRPQ